MWTPATPVPLRADAMTDKLADPTDRAYIATANAAASADLNADYAALGGVLSRRGIDIEAVTKAVGQFGVAIPSWGVGTGGTRFARFPGPGEPRNVFEKLEDCAVVQALTGATPTVSLHLPWDETSDLPALMEHAGKLGLGFDAVNSNTFQDRAGQALSYRFGSLTHTDGAVREQAKVESERKIDDERKAVDVVVRMDAGPQFFMGKLNIVGLDLDGEAEMKRIWTMTLGKPFNPDYPDLFLKRVREGGMFDDLGPTKSELKLNEREHTADVTLRFSASGPQQGRPSRRGRGRGGVLLTQSDPQP